MKQNKYKVYFVTGQIELVYAGGTESARILAQAEQIKKGHDYTVESIMVESKYNSDIYETVYHI